MQGASIPRRREYPEESSGDDSVNRRPYRDQRPPDRGRHLNQSGRPPDQRGYPDRGPPRRGYPHRNGRSPRRGGWPGGGPPDGDGGPPNDGGPPDSGGPSGDGGPPGPPGGYRPPSSQRPLGPVRPIIVQTPQVTLDTSALENTFDSVGQSMLQLARAQDQTNRQLKQHIQQGQLNMQAHMGALPATCHFYLSKEFQSYICKYTHI